MKPQPPCKNCPDLELGCKKNYQEWKDYRDAKEEWDAIVKAEKRRCSEIYELNLSARQRRRIKSEGGKDGDVYQRPSDRQNQAIRN